MKRKLLTLSLALCTAIGVNAQAVFTDVIPTGNANSSLRAPNGWDHTTLRAHYIIPASEVVGMTTGEIVTSVGFTLLQGAMGGSTGNMEFFLENTADVTNLKSTTWATAISTMTSVYNGAYTIPAAAGNIDLATTTPFTYTGGGLYVAYDYVSTTLGTGPDLGTGAAFYVCNASLGGSLIMDSTQVGSVAPAVLTQTSGFRPVITFQRDNLNANDVTVSGIRPILGSVNRTFSSASEAVGFITNTSNTALTNVDVTLNVTGANTFTATQTIPSMAAGAVELVSFTGIPTTADGTNTYTVTVPNDDDNTNNESISTQEVSCNDHSYAPQVPVTGGLGFGQGGTGSGLALIVVDVPTQGTLSAVVKSVKPTIANNPASVGNAIKGVLLNTAGVIVDSSASYTITTADLGQQVTLDFINGSVDYSGQSVFVGFRQTQNTTLGYFPIGLGDEFLTFPNTYYTAGPGGGVPAATTDFGAFLIDAELAFGVNASQSGITLTATTAATGMTYQWVNCADNSAITGETGSIYTVSNDIITSSYRVDATLDGCTGSSDCFFVSFANVIESENQVLTVFPNPAANVLNITSTIADAKAYTVYDLEGRVVLRSDLVNGAELTQINIDHLEAGTYLIEVVADQNSARKLFVKE